MAHLSNKDKAFIRDAMKNGRDTAYKAFAGYKSAFGIFFGHKVSKHQNRMLNLAWAYICEIHQQSV